MQTKIVRIKQARLWYKSLEGALIKVYTSVSTINPECYRTSLDDFIRIEDTEDISPSENVKELGSSSLG